MFFFFFFFGFWYCTFFSSCTFSVSHLFSWCTVAHFSCFILHLAASCCNVVVLLSCTIWMFYFFHTTVFSSLDFLRCSLFTLHHFSCYNIFMLYLLCTLFMLHLFKVWTFTFDLFCFTFFMVSFSAAAFHFTAHFSHYTLPCHSRFMSLLFSLALFSCCTFFIMHSPMANSKFLSYFVVIIGGWRRWYVFTFFEVFTSMLFCYCPHFENFPQTIPFPSYYINPSYHVKWTFFSRAKS